MDGWEINQVREYSELNGDKISQEQGLELPLETEEYGLPTARWISPECDL